MELTKTKVATTLRGTWSSLPYDTAVEVAKLLRGRKVLIRAKPGQWDFCKTFSGSSSIRPSNSAYFKQLAKISGRLRPGALLNAADDKLASHISLCQGFWLYRLLGSSFRECSSPASTRRLQEQLCELGDRSYRKDLDWTQAYRQSLLSWEPDITLPKLFAYFRDLRECRKIFEREYPSSSTSASGVRWSSPLVAYAGEKNDAYKGSWEPISSKSEVSSPPSSPEHSPKPAACDDASTSHSEASSSSYCPSVSSADSGSSADPEVFDTDQEDDGPEEDPDADIADAWLLPYHPHQESLGRGGGGWPRERSAAPSYIIQAAGSKVRITFSRGAVLVHMPHGKTDQNIGLSRGAAPAAIIWQDTVLAAPRVANVLEYLRWVSVS